MTILVTTRFVPIKDHRKGVYHDKCDKKTTVKEFMKQYFDIDNYFYDPCECCKGKKLKYITEDNERIYDEFLIKDWAKDNKLTIYMICEKYESIKINIHIKYNSKNYNIPLIYTKDNYLDNFYVDYLKYKIIDLIQIKKHELFCIKDFGKHSYYPTNNTHLSELVDEKNIINLECIFVSIGKIPKKKLPNTLNSKELIDFCKSQEKLLHKQPTYIPVKSPTKYYKKKEIDPIKELQNEFTSFELLIDAFKEQIKIGKLKYFKIKIKN